LSRSTYGTDSPIRSSIVIEIWFVSSSGFLFIGSILLIVTAGFYREVKECIAETPVGVDLADVDASLWQKEF